MKFKYFFASCLILTLPACGTIKKTWSDYAPDRDTQYLDEKPAAKIMIPEGMALNPAYVSDPYPLPTGALPAAGSEPVDIIPPTIKEEKADVATTS